MVRILSMNNPITWSSVSYWKQNLAGIGTYCTKLWMIVLTLIPVSYGNVFNNIESTIKNYLIAEITQIKSVSSSLIQAVQTTKTSKAAQNDDSSTPYSLPQCNDPSVLAVVQSILANNGTSNQGTIQIDQVQQISFDSQEQIMFCSAQVSATFYSFSIGYQESWQDINAGKWYVQVYRK
jgi:hypothetical protein